MNDTRNEFNELVEELEANHNETNNSTLTNLRTKTDLEKIIEKKSDLIEFYKYLNVENNIQNTICETYEKSGKYTAKLIIKAPADNNEKISKFFNIENCNILKNFFHYNYHLNYLIMSEDNLDLSISFFVTVDLDKTLKEKIKALYENNINDTFGKNVRIIASGDRNFKRYLLSDKDQDGSYNAHIILGNQYYYHPDDAVNFIDQHYDDFDWHHDKFVKTLVETLMGTTEKEPKILISNSDNLKLSRAICETLKKQMKIDLPDIIKYTALEIKNLESGKVNSLIEKLKASKGKINLESTEDVTKAKAKAKAS